MRLLGLARVAKRAAWTVSSRPLTEKHHSRPPSRRLLGGDVRHRQALARLESRSGFAHPAPYPSDRAGQGLGQVVAPGTTLGAAAIGLEIAPARPRSRRAAGRRSAATGVGSPSAIEVSLVRPGGGAVVGADDRHGRTPERLDRGQRELVVERVERGRAVRQDGLQGGRDLVASQRACTGWTVAPGTESAPLSRSAPIASNSGSLGISAMTSVWPRSRRCSTATSPTSVWSTTSVATCSSGVAPIASTRPRPVLAQRRHARGREVLGGRDQRRRAGRGRRRGRSSRRRRRARSARAACSRCARTPSRPPSPTRPPRARAATTERQQDDLGAPGAQRARHRVRHVAEPRAPRRGRGCGSLGDPAVRRR